MIPYDTSYRNTFKEYCGTDDIIAVLNQIHNISISITGTPDSELSVEGIASVNLTAIHRNGAYIEFTFSICIPILWGVSPRLFTCRDRYSDGGVCIRVDHSITYENTPGELSTPVGVLLKSLRVIPRRLITFNGDSTVSMRSGYNVSVRISQNTINITGGAGLGKGRYKGSTDPHTKEQYIGIKSINGIRAGRNVEIDLSDLLIEYGATVNYETTKKE